MSPPNVPGSGHPIQGEALMTVTRNSINTSVLFTVVSKIAQIVASVVSTQLASNVLKSIYVNRILTRGSPPDLSNFLIILVVVDTAISFVGALALGAMMARVSNMMSSLEWVPPEMAKFIMTGKKELARLDEVWQHHVDAVKAMETERDEDLEKLKQRQAEAEQNLKDVEDRIAKSRESAFPQYAHDVTTMNEEDVSSLKRYQVKVTKAEDALKHAETAWRDALDELEKKGDVIKRARLKVERDHDVDYGIAESAIDSARAARQNVVELLKFVSVDFAATRTLAYINVMALIRVIGHNTFFAYKTDGVRAIGGLRDMARALLITSSAIPFGASYQLAKDITPEMLRVGREVRLKKDADVVNVFSLMANFVTKAITMQLEAANKTVTGIARETYGFTRRLDSALREAANKSVRDSSEMASRIIANASLIMKGEPTPPLTFNGTPPLTSDRAGEAYLGIRHAFYDAIAGAFNERAISSRETASKLITDHDLDDKYRQLMEMIVTLFRTLVISELEAYRDRVSTDLANNDEEAIRRQMVLQKFGTLLAEPKDPNMTLGSLLSPDDTSTRDELVIVGLDEQIHKAVLNHRSTIGKAGRALDSYIHNVENLGDVSSTADLRVALDDMLTSTK